MATKTITGQVQIRNDTAHNWAVENPVLLPGELGLETDTGNGKFGDGETTWNSLKYAFQRNNNRSVEFIKTTNTKAGAALTGVSQDSSLYDGKTIFLFLSYAAAANATLNLTLADGTTTGAKNLYYTGTTRMGTHYGAGSVVTLTYVASVDGWRRADYNSNNQGQYEYQYNTSYFRSAVVAESIAVGDATGYVQAAAGVTFDISYPILWVTAAVAAGGTNYANTFVRHYDRNLTNVKSSFVGTPRKMVYLVVTLSGCTATIDDEVITDTVPTTPDGKVYIAIGRLGNQSNGKNYFLFQEMHPMYAFKAGAFRPLLDTPNVSVSINNPGTEVWIEVPMEHLIVGSDTPTDTNALWMEVMTS